MNIVDKNPIPAELFKDSVLIRLAAAYSAVAKSLERKTKCSQTRGFILATLRGGAALNSNQIATRLDLDRTVVHRAIKTMIREGLVSEAKAKSGRSRRRLRPLSCSSRCGGGGRSSLRRVVRLCGPTCGLPSPALRSLGHRSSRPGVAVDGGDGERTTGTKVNCSPRDCVSKRPLRNAQYGRVRPVAYVLL